MYDTRMMMTMMMTWLENVKRREKIVVKKVERYVWKKNEITFFIAFPPKGVEKRVVIFFWMLNACEKDMYIFLCTYSYVIPSTFSIVIAQRRFISLLSNSNDDDDEQEDDFFSGVYTQVTKKRWCSSFFMAWVTLFGWDYIFTRLEKERERNTTLPLLNFSVELCWSWVVTVEKTRKSVKKEGREMMSDFVSRWILNWNGTIKYQAK